MSSAWNFFTGSKTKHSSSDGYPRFGSFDIHRGSRSPYLEWHQIYHLACPASPWATISTHQDDQASTVGVVTVLMAGQRWARVLHCRDFSHSEVYGYPQCPILTRRLLGAINPYLTSKLLTTKGKRVAESLCVNFTRHPTFNFASIRIFTPMDPDGSA